MILKRTDYILERTSDGGYYAWLVVNIQCNAYGDSPEEAVENLQQTMEEFLDETSGEEEPDLYYEVTVTTPDGVQTVYQDSPEEIIIENPQLWWPNGLGAQPLYQIQVELKSGE